MMLIIKEKMNKRNSLLIIKLRIFNSVYAFDSTYSCMLKPKPHVERALETLSR